MRASNGEWRTGAHLEDGEVQINEDELFLRTFLLEAQVEKSEKSQIENGERFTKDGTGETEKEETRTAPPMLPLKGTQTWEHPIRPSSLPIGSPGDHDAGAPMLQNCDRKPVSLDKRKEKEETAAHQNCALVVPRASLDEHLEEIGLAVGVVFHPLGTSIRSGPVGRRDDHLRTAEEERFEGPRPGKVPACCWGSQHD